MRTRVRGRSIYAKTRSGPGLSYFLAGSVWIIGRCLLEKVHSPTLESAHGCRVWKPVARLLTESYILKQHKSQP